MDRPTAALQTVFASSTIWRRCVREPTTLRPPEGLSERGPCEDTRKLTTDVLTIFFGKYLHPHLGQLPPNHLPSSLIPPPLSLTPEQVPFAEGHLEAFRELDDATKCSGSSRWRTTSNPPRGATTFP